jgi:hypothetical protein
MIYYVTVLSAAASAIVWLCSHVIDDSTMNVYLTDHNMFTRLLITCKAMKQYARHYRMKRRLSSDQSVTLMDRYWPEMITKVSDVDTNYMSHINRMSSLVSIHFDQCYDDVFGTIVLPTSITSLSLSVKGPHQHWNAEWLPLSITTMTVSYLNIPHNATTLCDPLPPMLRSLTLHGAVQLSAGWLPSWLTELDLPRVVYGELDDAVLPEGLVSLSAGEVFRGVLKGVKAPDSLLHLTLMGVGDVDQTLAQGLPENLQSLTLYVNEYGRNHDIDRYSLILSVGIPSALVLASNILTVPVVSVTVSSVI